MQTFLDGLWAIGGFSCLFQGARLTLESRQFRGCEQREKVRILNVCSFFLLSAVSSVLAICNPEKPEEKFQLYMQIIDFFKGLCCVNTQFKQVGQSRVS